MNQEFKDRYSDELVRNVFRDTKRNELCINEADIISMSRSDRVSMDETHVDAT